MSPFYLSALAGISIGDFPYWLFLVLSLASLVYYGYAIVAALRFRSRSIAIDPDFHPPVSILKPLCGEGVQLYKNLASFCQQDYPTYQIVFAVRDYQDPSVSIVKQLMEDFPDVRTRLVIDPNVVGTNRKVCNLANAFPATEHEILVLADSDVRVGSDYLTRVVQPLRDPAVAVVTCMYRSLTSGFVTTWEAIGTATDFHPGVIVSTYLEGIKFAMGQTIVIRKSVLEEIGGFESIADYLADDFQLGYLPARAGYRVVLSTYIVEHVLGSSSFFASWQRQTRWTLCVRVSRIWGYIGLIFTHGTVTSLLFLIASRGSMLGWTLLGLVWTSRLLMAWLVGVAILDDATVKKWLWLVPARDIFSFALWCYCFIGDTVEWSNRRLKITRDGKLVPVENLVKS
ncbi:bacteriohopanetetrol glucosamine biosynthesis glycosyltransferase HpnI [Pannus brasiliensis CCIBt3594]|uniref:Bacteriohopanetetrol glucosamine biosynthesis glycosyltransferase HpnI n=1 Tax=Pannus brasiliensis CCIBt3594 TaxID=1427578 RepID=A0AAW9QVC2_9CHRO